MTMRQYWLGSVGPLWYDDVDTPYAIRVEGDIVVDGDIIGSAHFRGTADPSVSPGLAASVGAIYSRNNSGVGELWIKEGAGATNWKKVQLITPGP